MNSFPLPTSVAPQDTPFHPELTVFHPLSVEPYSEAELRTMVDYYLRTGPYKALPGCPPS